VLELQIADTANINVLGTVTKHLCSQDFYWGKGMRGAGESRVTTVSPLAVWDKQCDVLWWCGEDQRQATHKVVVWWKKNVGGGVGMVDCDCLPNTKKNFFPHPLLGHSVTFTREVTTTSNP
jgi:hypothetical protein